MLSGINQAYAVTWSNLRSLSTRLGSSAVAVFGTACVVGVLVGVLSMAAGFQKTMSAAGSEDVVILLRDGATSELNSSISNEQAMLISSMPGIMQDSEKTFASAELFVIVNIPKRTTATDANVPLRGVNRQGFAVRDNLKIIQGRIFEPGKNELLVGRGAHEQFLGLELGNTIEFARVQWKVVGVFEDNGSVSESEVWADAPIVQQVYKRGNDFQSVRAKLVNAQALSEFRTAIASDPRLKVSIRSEKDYYTEQSTNVSNFIKGLGYPLSILMAVGAIFGALNTMYASVSARTREIATLRALGFGNFPIIISTMVESVLLAFIGSVIGSAVVYLVFNGYSVSTMNWSSFSQVAFAFAVTAKLLWQGMFIAIGIGLLGGLFPAIRAVRVPIVVALRES